MRERSSPPTQDCDKSGYKSGYTPDKGEIRGKSGSLLTISVLTCPGGKKKAGHMPARITK